MSSSFFGAIHFEKNHTPAIARRKSRPSCGARRRGLARRHASALHCEQCGSAMPRKESGMGIRFSVKTRFVVNNKRYDSVEDMPPEARVAYDKAISLGASAGHPARLIMFNGQAYDTPDAMPPEVRRLYDTAMAGLSSDGFPPSAQVQEPKVDAIEPTGTSRWIFVALLAAAGS